MKIRETINIKQVELVNRLVMPPMESARTKDGTVTKRTLDYYREKSAGGFIGLIITEHSYVAMQGKANPWQLSISQEGDIAGLAQLAKVIHQNGTKTFAQISHAGSATSPKVTSMGTVSASPIINNGMTGRTGEMPEEMTKAQIAQVVSAFADAAKRAKVAGFDGVEIHAAHGYLLNQFYSPITNKRVDEYGAATMEGRLRLHREIIQAVRAAVGEDFPLALRLGGCDYMQGGSTVDDSVHAAVLLESWGIDLLDISGGINGYIVPGRSEPGFFREMTQAIKARVSIPVVLTGGITDISQAEALLEADCADLIGVGRAIMKDSGWAKRMMSK